MMHKKIISIHLIICFCVSGYSQTTVDAVLESYKQDKDLQHALYSYCVLEASTGKMIKEYNSELAMIPASTLKIITTASALGILGKDYTYKTQFYAAQKYDSLSKKNHSVLYVKGSGDPTFNSSYFFNNDSVFLNSIVKKIKDKEAQKSYATVFSDNSCFDNNVPGSWIWGDIANYFGACPNGISYKDNKISLYYNSGTNNSRTTLASVRPDYFSKKMTIESDVISGGSEDEAYVYGDPNSYARMVKGVIPPNKINYEVEAQMPNPHLFFQNQLSEELKKQNLLQADLLNSNFIFSYGLADQDQLLYTHTSPKLDKIVLFTNIKSNNLYAESLLKTIGLTKYIKQGTTESGIAVIKSFWKDRGVDVTGLHMVDGSGLSRANTVTTKIQATILSKVYKDTLVFKAFNSSLPIAGKSGSMMGLCKGTFAENNMRAKTGYINRVRAYCGYVKTKSGKELAFSIIFNNYDCSAKEMKLKIERFLVALVEL